MELEFAAVNVKFGSISGRCLKNRTGRTDKSAPVSIRKLNDDFSSKINKRHELVWPMADVATSAWLGRFPNLSYLDH